MTRQHSKLMCQQATESSIKLAEMMGYTTFENLYSGAYDLDLFLLVKPNTNLNSTFKAFDLDLHNIVTVNGWEYVVATEAEVAA